MKVVTPYKGIAGQGKEKAKQHSVRNNIAADFS